uniref:Uncharacterized protein n=1 Tax=Anguilla anguilla TaxID=7936 RepID=A0A0E9T3R3_ANGAN
MISKGNLRNQKTTKKLRKDIKMSWSVWICTFQTFGSARRLNKHCKKKCYDSK